MHLSSDLPSQVSFDLATEVSSVSKLRRQAMGIDGIDDDGGLPDATSRHRLQDAQRLGDIEDDEVEEEQEVCLVRVCVCVSVCVNANAWRMCARVCARARARMNVCGYMSVGTRVHGTIYQFVSSVQRGSLLLHAHGVHTTPQDDEEEGAANGELAEAQHPIFGHYDEEEDEEELREIVSHFRQHRTKRSSAFTSPKKSKSNDGIGKVGLVAASPRHQVCFVRSMNETCSQGREAESRWWFIDCDETNVACHSDPTFVAGCGRCFEGQSSPVQHGPLSR